MKIAMVTGSYPPDVCGVGDYTSKLVQALRQKGMDVEIFLKPRWKLAKAVQIAREISAAKPDIIHIQYPTFGFGSDLAPQVLSILLHPCVVTLHEASQVHILRRLSLIAFALRSRCLIFTTEHELKYSLNIVPWIGKWSTVIPIGSNISGNGKALTRDIDDVVFFGLLRPDRGIEDVIRLAELLKAGHFRYGVQIIGVPGQSSHDYLKRIRILSKDLPITWTIGLPEEDVAKLLARSRIAYVPYPDGASERRGSLLALLSNGVVAITTEGRFTSNAIRDTVLFAATPEQAFEVIQNIESDYAQQNELRKKALEYAARYDWDNIATKHIETYTQILAGGSSNR
jgi:glycosyltransferase involved in cell wall biosynthesis